MSERRFTTVSAVSGKARDAWGWGREWLSPVVQPDEPDLEFLHTRKIVGAGRLIILVFAIVFFGWATFAPLNSAVVAQGVVVVETHRKTIQHLEGGIVRQVFVSNGQLVRSGQMLVRLDDTQARAGLALLQGQSDALIAQEARLKAQRDNKDKIDFPPELLTRASDPKVSEAMRGEESTFQTQRETLQKQLDIVGQRSSENGKIIAGLRSEQTSVEKQIALIEQETASVQDLYAKGLSTLPRLLALKRQAADLNGQRGQIIEKISQVQMNSGENSMQAMDVRNQYMSSIVKELRDAQTRRFDLLDRLNASRDVLTRLSIHAPVSGKVVELSVYTNGAVVKAGDTLMEIVPSKDALEVEAHVRPEDADSIENGMPAHVSFSAYQRRRLPTLQGTVTNVSADRIVDQRTGLAYFNVRITVDRSPLAPFKDAKLIPGLPVEVSLETGERTALDYLIEPITDVFRRGMREK